MDDVALQKISTRTKVQMRSEKPYEATEVEGKERPVRMCGEHDEEGKVTKKSKATPLNTNIDKDKQVIEIPGWRLPKEKRSPKKNKGIYGKFLNTKKAEYDEKEFKVGGNLVNAEKQGAKKLVDLSALRRGLNYHGFDKDKLATENEQIDREQGQIEREKTLKQAADMHEQQQAEKKKKKSKDEEVAPLVRNCKESCKRCK